MGSFLVENNSPWSHFNTCNLHTFYFSFLRHKKEVDVEVCIWYWDIFSYSKYNTLFYCQHKICIQFVLLRFSAYKFIFIVYTFLFFKLYIYKLFTLYKLQKSKSN